MKKIKKLKLSEGMLNSKELKLLKGGSRNFNAVNGCECKYYNGPSVYNLNAPFVCECTCVY